MLREFIDTIPLWSVLIISFALVIIASELGFQLGQRRLRNPKSEEGSQVSSLTGAHLALLAFMMGFSFNMAANHHSARKMIVVEESNAIGTAYLRAELVDSAQGERIKQLLADYVSVRASIADEGVKASQVIAESESLQTKMWGVLDQSAEDEQLSTAQRLLVEALNEVFDLHEERVYAGLRSRIPVSIWLVLTVVTITAMMGMGYNFGIHDRRSPVATVVLALSFALVLFLISDLDRPGVGYMRPDNTTINQLNERLHESGAIPEQA